MSGKRPGLIGAIAVFLHNYKVITITIAVLSFLWFSSSLTPLKELDFQSFPYEAMIAFLTALAALTLGEVAGREDVERNVVGESHETDNITFQPPEKLGSKDDGSSDKLKKLDSKLASEYLEQWLQLREPLANRSFLEDFEFHYLLKLEDLRDWINKNNARFENASLKKLTNDVRWQIDELLEAGDWAFQGRGSIVEVRPKTRPGFISVTHDSILERLLNTCKKAEEAGIAVEEFLRETDVSWPPSEGTKPEAQSQRLT